MENYIRRSCCQFFIHVINPNVSDSCPFCEERETIFHCFYRMFKTQLVYLIFLQFFLIS